MEEILIPKVNNNDEKVKILRWHKNDNDYVLPGEHLLDVETSKVVVAIESTHEGYLQKICKDSDICLVGQPAARVYKNKMELDGTLKKDNGEKPSIEKSLSNSPDVSVSIHGEKWLSNAASMYVEGLGLQKGDLDVGGMITKRHLGLHNQKLDINKTEVNPVVVSKGPICAYEEKVGLGKQAEIEQLSIGSSGGINSTLTMMIKCVVGKQRMNLSDAQKLIYWSVASAASKNPKLTSYYEGGEVRYYERVDLGIALDMGSGLKVARIKNANKLTLKDLNIAYLDLCLKYARGELTLDDLTESTITISDLSTFGILNFIPLINGYQSIIIGIGSDFVGGGDNIYINATFDHRILTGREVADFLNTLRDVFKSHNNE